MNDFMPSDSVIALLIAVLGLLALRIPQAARTLAFSFAKLNREQERKIEAQAHEIAELRELHEECERRSDDQERRLVSQGRRIAELERRV